jgi:uncharacterized protein YeaO (DUF488 family)
MVAEAEDMTANITIKRVYAPADPGDGLRVLVDRVWPRGLKKEQVQADVWLKDAAPSTALRKLFCHDPAKWADFKAGYTAELNCQTQAVTTLLNAAAKGPLTLLYSARDTEFNQAAALREYLLSKMGENNG